MNLASLLSRYRAWRDRLPMLRIITVVANVALWIGALLCVAPLLILLVESFRSSFNGPFHRPALLNYLFVLRSDQLWVAFKNTSIQEIIVLTSTLFFCPLAGYGFAKFTFHGKALLFGVMMLTLFFAPITLLIPLLLEMNEIGWLDTYQGLVMPLVISSLGIFWMTMVIRGVPDELLHAARLDGCGVFSIWWRIILPVIKPSLLALAFFTFMTAYNDYLWPLLILLDPAMQTIQLFLQNGSGYGYGGASPATAVVASLPTVAAFLLMQRSFLPELFGRDEVLLAEGEDDLQPDLAPAARPATPVLPEPAAWSPGPKRTRAMALSIVGLCPWPSVRTVWLVQCTAIIVCILGVYANALHTGFQLDDLYRVVDNPGIAQVMPIWRHFTDPQTSAALPSLAQFRPLLPLSLSISYALAGNSVVGYRLGNLLLDMAAGGVVYLLARELLGHWFLTRAPRSGRSSPAAVRDQRVAQRLPQYRADFLAMVVALLVALHPVSGLLVTYISGRDLLMMEIFLCASLLVYIRMRRRNFAPTEGPSFDEHIAVRLMRRWFGTSRSGWLVALALFELALLAKAQALVVPALVLSFEVTVGREHLTRLTPWVRALPFILVAACHLAYLDLCLHFTVLPDASSLGFAAMGTYPLTQARLSVFHYLRNFAWPFNIHLIPVAASVNSMHDPGVLVGLAVIGGSLVGAQLLRRTNPLLALCLVAYWIAQSPESSVEPMLHNAADYRPYPASPFLMLALVLMLNRYLKPVQATIALLALIVLCGAASVQMNASWQH